MALIRTRTISGFRYPLSLLATVTLVAATSCVVKNSGSDGEAGEGGDAGESSKGGTSAAAGAGTGGTGGASAGAGAGGTAANGGSGATAGGSAAGAGGHSGASPTTGGTGAAGGGGEAGAAPSDNCPDDPEPDQTDTDHDGLGDVCDPDDDDDGFRDENDPEPKNPAVPGDYSTPEKVLANPTVKEALAALHDAGYDLVTHTETSPPDVSGYHRKDEGDGEFVANSGGGGVGSPIVGFENRVDHNDDGTLDTFQVGFADGEATSYTVQRGQLLRGTGDEFTIYATSRLVCTESGSDYTTYALRITSGTLDAQTGDWKNTLSLNVTVASRGTLSSACASRANGLTENVDEWAASSTELIVRVKPADLEYLCVDGDAGYAPTETWTGTGGKACECTTAYAVSCDQ